RPARFIHVHAGHAESGRRGQADFGVSVIESGSTTAAASTPSARCFACELDPENREAGAGHASDLRAAARDPEGSPESEYPHSDHESRGGRSHSLAAVE